MFSVQQKRDISDAVQKILRATNHPELPPTGEIAFTLHVDGAGDWSWADIQNNGAVGDPGVNPHNELMASLPEEEGRGLIEQAKEHLAVEKPDPRNTPEEFFKEMLENNIITLKEDNKSLHARIDKLESALSADSGTADSDVNPLVSPMEQLRRVVSKIHDIEDKDKIHRKLYSELRFGLDKLEEFLTPIMEDNLIAHHSDQLNNLMTAIKQLGTGQLIEKDPKKCPDCGIEEGMEHAPDCTALEVKNTIGDA